MKYLVLLFGIVFLFGVIACDEDNNPADSGNGDGDIIPLKVGYWWHYQEYDHGSETMDFRIEVTGTRTINGQDAYILSIEGDFGNYVYLGEEGMYQYNEDPEDFTLWYKYPAVTGDTYSTDHDTCEVTSTNSSITVPAGTFEGCYEYEFSNGGLSKEYVKPSVGMIYFVSYSDSGIAYESKLMEYNVTVEDTTSSPPDSGGITILGNWDSQPPYDDNGAPNIMNVTVDELIFAWDDTTRGDVKSNIVEYSNDDSLAVLLITEHPSVPQQVGMYIKIKWILLSDNGLDLEIYALNETREGALEETEIAWGTWHYIKI